MSKWDGSGREPPSWVVICAGLIILTVLSVTGVLSEWVRILESGL